MGHRYGQAVLGIVAALLFLGCASTYDPERVERRTQALYVGRDASGPQAQSAPNEPSAAQSASLLQKAELAEYLAYGLANSATLRAAFEEWRASTERVEQVSTLPDPRLTYGEFIEEVQTRTGPQERRFGISQAFPWPGERSARARRAERHSEGRWEAVESERLRVAASIEVAFHEYAFLARELSITKKLLELLRGLEPIVQTRVRAGAGQADILQLQVEIGRLEDELGSIESRRPVLSARLAQAMNLRLEPSAVLPFPELREPEAVAVDVQQHYARALEHNPDLQRLLREREAAREAEAVVAYRRKPGFAVGLDYIDTGSASGSGVSGSGDDPLLVSLSMSLPVWTSSYSAAEREARHLLRASQERIAAQEIALKAEVEEEAYRIGDATRQMALYRHSLIPRSQEALELTLASYRTGKASAFDLIDSERALLEFELSYWRACRDYLQGLARLGALTSDAERGAEE